MRYGVGSSGFQIEGKEGRSLSVWDLYLEKEGTLDGSDPSYGTDFLKCYKEDIALAKDLGISDFRFGVSYSRVISEDGSFNKRGIRFYKDLAQAIKEAGLRPVCTLYHWDLPQIYENEGGWTKRDMAYRFASYARFLSESFGDLVSSYVTFNEPQCFLGLGYQKGLGHAPDTEHDYEAMLRSVHHVLLGHALASEAIRKRNPKAEILFVNTADIPLPIRKGDLSLERALSKMLFSIPKDARSFYTESLFLDPLYFGSYPAEIRERSSLSFVEEGDMELIHKGKPDALALNIYTGHYYDLDKEGKVVEVREEEGPKSPLSWLNFHPLALYYGPKYFYLRYGAPILITENGGCYDDRLEEGKIHDPDRINYLSSYLDALKKAKKEGVPVLGYYYWSLTDNLEWKEGVSKRFGLVYVDYKKGCLRIPKDSYFAYRDIIAKDKD